MWKSAINVWGGGRYNMCSLSMASVTPDIRENDSTRRVDKWRWGLRLLVMMVVGGSCAGCSVFPPGHPVGASTISGKLADSGKVVTLSSDGVLVRPTSFTSPYIRSLAEETKRDDHVSSVSSGQLSLCQKELDALKLISPANYAASKADFDGLVHSASVYAQVRNGVSGNTKDTLDALYRYKTNQICMQIERHVQDGLIRRGESVK